ncbi:MAG: hypothetical protein O9322_05525 [Beijerinckiaceae bacterium]|nr:hypothetical protein [Beijerinckiaceae bacterium]MCZ8298982.1 hypothetical protein [Beijerinckiaceae bacterium]
MFGAFSKRLRIRFLASAALVAASISNPVLAFFDPVTVGACISLASSAMSLFSSKTNPQATQMDAVLTHVRAINQRLDKIEDGVVTILERVEQLPSRWREDMKGMVDELTSQDARAYAAVIDDYFAGLRDARAHRNTRQRQDMLNRLKEAVVPFQKSSKALLERSGAVAPAVVMMMVRDVWLERHFGTLDITISDKLAQYDQYFASMQDDQSPGSIAHVRAALEVARRAERKTLLNALSGNEASPSLEGTYHFYSATLNEVRHRDERRTRTRVRCFGRGEYHDCVDSEHEFTEKVPYSHPVKTVHHRWIVKEAPRANHPDLSVITIEEQTTEAPGASATPAEPTPDLDATDRRFDGRRANIRKSVDMLNLRDEALALLRDNETAVALARSLIVSWDNDTAEALGQRTSLLAARSIDRYRRAFEDHEADLIVQATRAGIADARKIAKDSVASAERIHAAALEQARKSAWQREVGQIFAVAQFGWQAYQTVNLVLTKFPPPPVDPTPRGPATEPRKQEAEVTEKKPVTKPFRVTLERNAAPRSFTLAAQQLIEQAEKAPPALWVKGIPRNRPVKSEAMLQQAINFLDMADKAALAFSGGASAGKSDVAILRDTVTSMRQGKMFDAFIKSLTPSSTSDQDMLGGLHHRNLLRKRALEELSGFIQIRTEQERRLMAPTR